MNKLTNGSDSAEGSEHPPRMRFGGKHLQATSDSLQASDSALSCSVLTEKENPQHHCTSLYPHTHTHTQNMIWWNGLDKASSRGENDKVLQSPMTD